MIELPGDSGDYHLLTKGIELSKDIEGMTCEIGLRRGGGTRVILDALHIHSPKKFHIAVDPYGSIEYEHKEGEIVRLDYTNQMKCECLSNLYKYSTEINQDFDFYPLEDTEFFKRYADGVPLYDNVKRIENKYSFVHFDGPHAVAPLLTEIDFFKERMNAGTCWCFDDVKNYYDHDKIEKYLFELGFKLIEKLDHKALYQFKG